MLETLAQILRAHDDAWQAKVTAVVAAKAAARDLIEAHVQASNAAAEAGAASRERLAALDAAFDVAFAVGLTDEQRTAIVDRIAVERAAIAGVIEPLMEAASATRAELESADRRVRAAGEAMKAGVTIEEAIASLAAQQ